MELSEVIRTRRMVRRYDPDVPVPLETIVACLQAATRAPSAGFSQGWDFVVLTSPADRALFWRVSTDELEADERAQAGHPVDPWLAGVSAAPVLILCLADKDAYLERYAEPDKGWTDRDEAHWPVPYWDVDTGMAALLALLTATDGGWGSLFFGVPAEGHDDVLAAFDIPRERTLVGVVAIGRALPGPKSPSLRRGRRGVDEVAHWGRFGRHTPPA